LRRARDEERQAMAETLAAEVHQRLVDHFRGLARELRRAFRDVDSRVSQRVGSSVPGDDKSTWWRRQLVRAAKETNFWANLAGGTWWVQLTLSVLDHDMRYVAAIQRVGAGLGVMALTVFAEMPQPQPEDDAEREVIPPVPLIRLASTDSVTMVG